jgi:hypothetical protein
MVSLNSVALLVIIIYSGRIQGYFNVVILVEENTMKHNCEFFSNRISEREQSGPQEIAQEPLLR